jgi:hypothetical protein
MTSSNGSAPRIPNLPLTTMYERTDRRGRRYIVGRLGNLKLMVFATGEVSKGDRIWHAFLTEIRHHTSPDAAAIAQRLDEESKEAA